MAQVNEYEFLDKTGVRQLAKDLLNTVNSRISERIVTEVTDTSDDKHVPSAAAVYKAITSRNHVGIITVTGDINEKVPLEKRSTSMIYFQRDDAEDKTWSIYIWNTNSEDDDVDFVPGWICIGDTEVDLDKYWSKDDIDDLKQALGLNDLQPPEDLSELKEDVNTLKSNVSNLQTEVEKKVNTEDLSSISSEDLMAILEQVKNETDVMGDGHDDEDEKSKGTGDDLDSEPPVFSDDL